jgi:MFS family permease
LPAYLVQLGFSGFEVGAIVTGTLLGSAALTLALGLVAHRFSRRRLVFAACVLTVATGCGFALSATFWPILIVAVVGTMNPSAGDVSVFLPLEQALLPHTIGSKGRTSLFALYSLVGRLLGAFGSLAGMIPDRLAPLGWSGPEAIRVMF